MLNTTALVDIPCSENLAGPFISDDARYVAFETSASLVANDTDNLSDVYVFDRESNQAELISLDPETGQVADGSSIVVDMTPDGRYVLFESMADNLPGDDCYLYILDLNTDILSPIHGDYNRFASVSDNGRMVAFASHTNPYDGNYSAFLQVYFHDVATGYYGLVSADSSGNPVSGCSMIPRISGNGEWLVYESNSCDILNGNTNGTTHVILYDIYSGYNLPISVTFDGLPANGGSCDAVISYDGSMVAYSSVADNLVSGDTNLKQDIFLYDVTANITRRISLASDGTQWNTDSRSPHISADGSAVIFETITSSSTGDYHVYKYDVGTGSISLLTENTSGGLPNDDTEATDISGDGRYVIFDSQATDLVTEQVAGRNIYIVDRDGVEVKPPPEPVKSLKFTDSDGDLVRIKIAGPGRMYITDHSGAMPDKNDIANIDMINSTWRSKLIVSVIPSAAGDGRSSIGNITVDGNIRMIHARKSDIVGDVTIAGNVRMIIGGRLIDSTITILGTAAMRMGRFDQITNSTINAARSISRFFIRNWTRGSIIRGRAFRVFRGT